MLCKTTLICLGCRELVPEYSVNKYHFVLVHTRLVFSHRECFVVVIYICHWYQSFNAVCGC